MLSVQVRPREQLAAAKPLVTILESDDVRLLARFAAPQFAQLRLGQFATVSANGSLYVARISGLVGPQEPVPGPARKVLGLHRARFPLRAIRMACTPRGS